jgi:hypothetical protein
MENQNQQMEHRHRKPPRKAGIDLDALRAGHLSRGPTRA